MIVLNTKIIIWLLTIIHSLTLIMANINNFHIYTSQTVADIVKSCEINDHSSIFIAGNFNSNDIQQLPGIKPKIMKNNLELPKQLTERTIELLIISADSAGSLEKFFIQITQSLTWNRLKYSVILNKSTMNSSCDEYFHYLYIALKHDIINTIYLCITSSKQIMYSFNPYVSWAPAPWKISQQQWNHTESGYIYTTEYRPNTITCEDLFFDKTRRLNGYHGVKAVSFTPLPYLHRTFFYNYNLSPKKVFDYRMIQSLFTYLGVSFSNTVSTDYGTFDEDGRSCGVDEYVAESKFDILSDSRFLSYTNDSVYSSSTLGETGVSFVSHNRGNVSTIMRIINYFRPIIMFFSVLVLGITIVILKISINESYSKAIMEVVRIFFNGPLLKVPNKHSPRIYIFTILIFILVMQTILRSKILSFIMSPESNNLETFAELANHKEYSVHCKKGFDYFLPPEIRKRCHIDTFYEHIINDTKKVFIWDKFSNIGMSYLHKLHASKEIVAKHHLVFRMRKNWPLAKKANKIIVRIFESGINRNYLEFAKFYVQLKNKRLIRVDENISRSLNLQDLEFVFQIYVFGLILACIMFFIEIKSWEYLRQYFNRILSVQKRNSKYSKKKC